MVSSCLDRDERASYLGWKRRSGRGQMAQLGGTLAGGGGAMGNPHHPRSPVLPKKSPRLLRACHHLPEDWGSPLSPPEHE